MEYNRAMPTTVWAVVRQGKIEPEETLELPEGAKVLVTVLTEEDEIQFWLRSSETALTKVWDNPEDDVYAQLLQR